MNKKMFTPQVIDLIDLSVKECLRFGSEKLYSQHYLLSLINTQSGIGYQLLKFTEIDINELKKKLIVSINKINKIDAKKITKVLYSEEFNKILQNSETISNELNSESISTEHILISSISTECESKHILESFGLNKNKLKIAFDDMLFSVHNNESENGNVVVDHGDSIGANPKNKKISLLKHFGLNLNDQVKNGKIDKIIGREKEIERMINILSRMKKNNPLLLGESGVGKTSILEGLALKIVTKNVPNQLRDKKIIMLDLAALVAGTKYRGQFEERLKTIIKEAEEDPHLILAIDEIHNLVNAGSAEGTLDASNILKEPLSRGNFRCIGLTTWKEYRKHIEPDSALCRRFNILNIEQPSAKQTIEILNGIKEKYEKFHFVKYSEDILEYIVKLSQRYIHNKNFPDKAIDILDEVGSYKKLSFIIDDENIKKLEEKINKCNNKLNNLKNQEKWNECKKEQKAKEKYSEELHNLEKQQLENIDNEKREINYNDISFIVQNMTGIPVSHSEDNISSLKNIYNEITNHIKGQDEAVDSIYKAVLRGKTGLKSPNKPIATLLFAGKTGVGKTETARILAQVMFGDKKALIREDMSNYSEKHSVSKMVGCFSKGNKIYVKDKGLVNIEDIKQDDLVLTHKDRFKKVIKIHSYKHSGNVIRLKWMHNNDSVKISEITCTPDHEFLTIKENSNTPQWIKAKDLVYNQESCNDLLLIPTNFKEEEIQNKEIILPTATTLATIWTTIKYIGSFLSIVKTCYEIYKTVKEDDSINIKNYKKCKIVSRILDTSYDDFVYDLSVENDTSYTVSGAIVHNSPPGYVGYDEGGNLTNKVAQNPYSIILLDEAEKADKNVWDLLLPMFEEGRLVDSKTNKSIDFRNTIIILTTNIGSQLGDIDVIGLNTKHNIELDYDYGKLKEKTKKEIENVLSPEFINRIDEIIVFRELSNENIKQIINLIVDDYNSHVNDIKKFKIELTDTLYDYLIKNGYSKKYGARELRRIFDKTVIDNLVQYYIVNLEGKIKSNSIIVCDIDKEEKVTFSIK